MSTKVALITGAARRIGAEIARELHAAGLNIIIHYHQSAPDAHMLCDVLNRLRPDSAVAIACDLLQFSDYDAFVQHALAAFGRIDVLVNNASSYYPTINTTSAQWDALMGINLKAPYFLTQALSGELCEREGCVVNICDTNAFTAKMNYEVYCTAKAGLIALTKQNAVQLAPRVRVNAISPGMTLPPEGSAAVPPDDYRKLLAKIPLKKSADPQDVAKTVRFVALEAEHITGQVIAVDGGQAL